MFFKFIYKNNLMRGGPPFLLHSRSLHHFKDISFFQMLFYSSSAVSCSVTHSNTGSSFETRLSKAHGCLRQEIKTLTLSASSTYLAPKIYKCLFIAIYEQHWVFVSLVRSQRNEDDVICCCSRSASALLIRSHVLVETSTLARTGAVIIVRFMRPRTPERRTCVL